MTRRLSLLALLAAVALVGLTPRARAQVTCDTRWADIETKTAAVQAQTAALPPAPLQGAIAAINALASAEVALKTAETDFKAAGCVAPTPPPPPPPPPALTMTCPANQAVTGPAGTVITYATPTTAGGTPPISVLSAPPSGSGFPLGVTSVSASATDAASQTATCSFTVTLTAPPPPQPPPGGKILLSQADFQFLGGFKIPSPDPGGGDTSWGRGMAIRSGNLLINSLGMDISEWTIPATLGQTVTTFPNATAVRMWTGATFAKRYTVQYGIGSGFVQGIYWDPVDQRLYYGYGDTYKVNTNPDPSIGYETVNASGATTSVDSWQVGNNSKMTMGGVFAIPDWWSTQHTPGRRLAAGFGGYQSIVAQGPASMGLALFAFNPRDLDATPSHGKVPSSTMVMYPYTQGCTARMQRDADYRTEFDNCNPVNGVGFHAWVDNMPQSATWIDTPTKTGVLVAHIEGNGRLWYQTSTGHAERGSHWFRIYDPADLAEVVHGTKQPWAIQPRVTWPVQFPAAFSYPLPSWQDEPTFMIIGVVWDAASSRLFVAVRFATGFTSSGRTVVYVYRIN